MRDLSYGALAVIAAVLAVGAAACAPSNKQVASAKLARYQGDRQQIFSVVKQTVESKYKIERADETALGLQTVGRWYNPDGQGISATMEDLRDVPDRSLLISLVVELLPERDRFVVAVTPKIQRFIKGRPNPDVLEPSDPSLPGWALGKGENLQVEIYEALKPFEVQAAAAAPAPAPAAPASVPAAPASVPAAPAPVPAP